MRRTMILVTRAMVPSASEEAYEIVAGVVWLLAADLDDCAIGQHGFESEYVVGGDAVGQCVRAAGIFRNITADGASALARGIGSVEVAERLHGQRDIQINDAWLDDRSLVLDIDFENLIHARKGDEKASGAGDRAAAEAGACATADDGKIVIAR